MKNNNKKIIYIIIITLILGIVIDNKMSMVNATQIGLNYCGHVQDYGDLNVVSDGEVLGYPGSGKRLEAITINNTLEGVSGEIRYNAHVQDVGWQGWKVQGQQAGVVGLGKRLEAIQMELSGDVANQYDIYYKMCIANIGWLEWAKNGEIAGTIGYSCVVEAVQIKLVLKENSGTVDTSGVECLSADTIGNINYYGHVQNIGDVTAVTNNQVLGTTGCGLRIEAININFLPNKISGGLTYGVHVQDIGWQDNRVQGQLAGTSGMSKRLEALNISLTGDMANYCDIWYRVHIQDFGWMGWAKNGQNSGSSRIGRRMEAIQIVLVPKGGQVPGNNSNYFRNTTAEEDEINYYTDSIIGQVTTSAMSQEQKLKACYDWTVHNCTYKSVFTSVPGNYSFKQWYGLNMLKTRQGNCYSYASAFAILADRLGYNANVVQGYIQTQSGRWSAHGWVEISGVKYDPEIEWAHGYNCYAGASPRVYKYQ